MFRSLIELLGIRAASDPHLLRTAVRKHRVATGRAGQIGRAVARNENADRATADLTSCVANLQTVSDLRALTAGVLDRKPRP